MCSISLDQSTIACLRDRGVLSRAYPCRDDGFRTDEGRSALKVRGRHCRQGFASCDLYFLVDAI